MQPFLKLIRPLCHIYLPFKEQRTSIQSPTAGAPLHGHLSVCVWHGKALEHHKEALLVCRPYSMDRW